MNELKNKIALVTGGSRGLGRGIVETLAAQGVHVWALARDGERLETLKQEVPGVDIIAADVTDPTVAAEALHEICPDILVLNAGATPTMLPAHQQTWEQFSRVWETDVKSTFEFGKEALNMPMQPGSTVMIVSSGAAITGSSQLADSYAGAKRMQWFMTQYFQKEANALNRGIRFIALVPQQIVGTTDLGDASATYYAVQQGITKEAVLERMGAPLTPEFVGQGVISLLTESAYRDGIAFGISSQGLESLN